MPRPLSAAQIIALVFVALAALFPAAAGAQAIEGLAMGPHAVGYTGGYHRDPSRVFFARGAGAARQDGSRPIQVRIFYPAAPRTGRAMTYGDVAPLPGGAALSPVSSDFDARNAEMRRYMFRKYQAGEEAALLPRLLASPLQARVEAQPAAGRHPVLIYGGGAGFMVEENLLLWEYLASHGYVVIAVPTQGPASVGFAVDGSGLEALTRDMEFAFALARTLPYADSDRVAVAGFSYGGAAAMLMAMRNSDVRAVIGYDASFTSEEVGRFLRAAPDFSLNRLVQPLLEFHNVLPDSRFSDTVAKARYSDRVTVEVLDAEHPDFTSAAALMHRLVGERSLPNRSLAQRAALFAQMAERTRMFLDQYLAGRADTGGRVAAPMPASLGQTRVHVAAAIPVPPSAVELAEAVRAQGAKALAQRVADLRRRDPEAESISADALNRLGYSLLEQKVADAIEVFRWNVSAHPDAANFYDSLADGYATSGETGCAAAAYRKVLELVARGGGNAAENANLRSIAERRLAEIGAAAAPCPSFPA
jgi:dienelactone hydrolase